MRTLALTDEDAELAAAALDGLANQLAARAAHMLHGPQQVATCEAIGRLRRLARQTRGERPPET